ncbi:hypothetical protein ACC782_33560 [Rhizobium ruizarguesonis]
MMMAILINVALAFAGGSLLFAGQPAAGVALVIAGFLFGITLSQMVSKT